MPIFTEENSLKKVPSISFSHNYSAEIFRAQDGWQVKPFLLLLYVSPYGDSNAIPCFLYPVFTWVQLRTLSGKAPGCAIRTLWDEWALLKHKRAPLVPESFTSQPLPICLSSEVLIASAPTPTLWVVQTHQTSPKNWSLNYTLSVFW